MIRVLDAMLSLAALLVLAAFLLPVVIILKLTGEGEVFYVQERVGRGGNLFGLLKFATMLKDSPNIGTGDITLQNDYRVLPFGRFLRKTKINELPQLWNILRGDMSIVGPRPMVPNTYELYTGETRQVLDSVRPGLTGLGSIFFRDEELYLADKSDPIKFYKEQIIPYKSHLELWFVLNRNTWLYVKIILVTVWVVLYPPSTLPKKVFRELPPVPFGLG